MRIRFVILVYVILAALSVVWGVLRGSANICSLPNGDGFCWYHPLLGFAVGVVVAILTRIGHRRWRWIRELNREFRRILGPLSSVQLLLFAVLSGVCEEMFFRGAMQPSLGLVWTSLIFGLLHIGPDRRFIPWTASAVAAGFLLGGLAEWTGNLAAPITAHFTINLLNLRMMYRRNPQELP